jgi:hypothetical protein
MPTELPDAPSGLRAWPWVATVCEVAAVLAWLLLVLRDQYGVVSPHARSLAGARPKVAGSCSGWLSPSG